MDRAQKSAAIEEIADEIRQAEAVFAVDFRGISVPQAADVRTRLRDADARFRVVKNTLTERAADAAGAESLKELLEGPTALTFVRGDVAVAAKAIATFNRDTRLLEFKGGLLGGDRLAPEQIQAIARLPARDALYGQLVGVVASPITGLVRTLNALIAGLAVQLGQIAEKKQSGEIPAGDAPAAAAGAEAEGGAAAAGDQDAEPPEPPAAAEAPAEGAPDAGDASPDDTPAAAGEATATGDASPDDTPAAGDATAAGDDNPSDNE
jgi:large subunit ribosomal protein L10